MYVKRRNTHTHTHTHTHRHTHTYTHTDHGPQTRGGNTQESNNNTTCAHPHTFAHHRRNQFFVRHKHSSLNLVLSFTSLSIKTNNHTFIPSEQYSSLKQTLSHQASRFLLSSVAFLFTMLCHCYSAIPLGAIQFKVDGNTHKKLSS
jgi:hypothetical protein